MMVPVQLLDIPARRYTEETIRLMTRGVEQSRPDRELQDLAADIVRSCPAKDGDCMIDALLDAIRQTVKYIWDPHGIERVQAPWYTFMLRRGDCDDMVVLLAALATGVGFDYRFVTVKAQRDEQGNIIDQWSHVYVELKPPNGPWKPADPIVPGAEYGWALPGKFERKRWPRRI